MNTFLSLCSSDGEKLDVKMKKLETQYGSLQVVSTITKLGTHQVRGILQ